MAFGMLLRDDYESNSTPNLSLSMLNPPCNNKLRGGHGPPIQMLTPPLHPSLSIPFKWEVVPGKPKLTSLETRVNSTLSNDDHQITKMPSPTTVLDGPYVGRSLSLACTFSFRKGPLRPKKKGKDIIGSWRFGSFSEKDEGSFGYSHTLGDFFKSEENVNGCGRRVGRKRRFFNLSGWGDIYASFKQALPWKHRR